MRTALGTAVFLTAIWTNGLAQCGVERWSVKTGTDTDASFVNVNTFKSATIAALTALSAPSKLPEAQRVQPTETTVFMLNATLTEYKLEDDSDYHLVLADSAGRTMIAEIPLPACIGSASPLLAGVNNARSEFDAHLKATASFKAANVPVQIKGVGFFDFNHGQTGVAPNAIELHPVLDIIFNPAISNPPTITSINSAGGISDIAQNTWIEIHGANLAPSSIGPNGLTWGSAPEFALGRMPTQVDSVSVSVNGKSAYVYYLSPTQVNVLTPLDGTVGPVQVVLTNGANSSAPFSVNLRPVAPSFIPVGGTKYVVSTHADGSLIGPVSISVPGYAFTPAQPGETIVLYGFGFGLPTTPLIDGAAVQSGPLPSPPIIQIGGTAATVQYAGVISPGLYQFNVVVPDSAADGDNTLAATYGGVNTPALTLITIQENQ